MPTITIPGVTETAVAWDRTGLVGLIGVRVVDNVGGTPFGRNTVLVTEYPASSGIYQATIPDFAIAGDYTIVWDDFVRYDAIPLTLTGVAVGTGFTADFDTPVLTFAGFGESTPVLTGSFGRPLA